MSVFGAEVYTVDGAWCVEFGNVILSAPNGRLQITVDGVGPVVVEEMSIEDRRKIYRLVDALPEIHRRLLR